MLLKVNLRLLAEGPIQLDGELPLKEFLEDFRDELVRFVSPVCYNLVVERDGEGLLMKGTVKAGLGMRLCAVFEELSDDLGNRRFFGGDPDGRGGGPGQRR
jgi:hypothetical protein